LHINLIWSNLRLIDLYYKRMQVHLILLLIIKPIAMYCLINSKDLCSADMCVNENARKTRLSRHKAIQTRFALFIFLFIWMTFPGLNIQAQEVHPFEHTIRLEGVPADIEVTRSYRQTTNVYYSMPSGKTIFDYDDIDKVYMEPRGTDERIVIGRNAENEMILIYEVMDPETQFKPAVLGHNYVIFSDGFVRFYDENGSIIFIDTTTLQPIEELEGEPEVEYHFNDLGSGVFELSDDFMIQWVDTVSGIIITRYYDEEHEWKASSFEFYSANGVISTFPVLEISYELVTTIMGETAYRVTTTRFTEYFEDERTEGRIENRSNGNNHQKPDLTRIENLDIVPNPAIDFISVGFPGLDKPEDVEIKIFSMNGALLLEQTIVTDGYHTLLLPAEWPAGLYILNARSEHSLWIDKFVKN